MISINKLTKYYGEFCALDSIDFKINKGEILGLLGPNGAGKTTTLRLLTCYLDPTSGTIDVKDFNIADNPLEIKELIGYLPESAPIYPDMITYDYLNFVAEIRGINPDKKAQRIQELVEICGLYEIMHKFINELSKGYKQRVGLAHAMMGDPEILVFDEPTAGLDPNQIVEIRELIKKIGKEKTVVLSSHILSEVEATCDRVVIINRGKIVADGTVDDLKKSGSKGTDVHLAFKDAEFDDIKEALKDVKDVKNISENSVEDGVIYVTVKSSSDSDLRPEIYKIIKKKNWMLMEFTRKTQSLENIFRELTREDDHEGSNSL